MLGSHTKNNLYVTTSTGTIVYFRRRELEEKIQQAAAQTGFKDSWLAADISYAIEKHLERLKESGAELLSESAVDLFVVNLLTDAGFNEEAYHYAALNHGCFKEPAVERHALPWNPPRIEKLLTENPLFLNYDLQLLTNQVLMCLQRLNFRKVTDSLIIELANQSLAEKSSQPQSESEPERTSGHAMLLLNVDELREKLPKRLIDWHEKGQLMLHAISRLYPKLEMEWHLDLFLNDQFTADEYLLFELLVLPRLNGEIEQFAAATGGEAENLRQAYPELTAPTHITVSGLDRWLNESLQVRGRRKIQLRQEISSLIRRLFETHHKGKLQLNIT